jgi:hypothetical protein
MNRPVKLLSHALALLASACVFAMDVLKAAEGYLEAGELVSGLFRTGGLPLHPVPALGAGRSLTDRRSCISERGVPLARKP